MTSNEKLENDVFKAFYVKILRDIFSRNYNVSFNYVKRMEIKLFVTKNGIYSHKLTKILGKIDHLHFLSLLRPGFSRVIKWLC